MRVYDLLIGKGHWTKHAYGRLRTVPKAEESEKGEMIWGKSCDSTSQGVCCWCLSGAVQYCYPNYWDEKEAYLKLASSIRELFPRRFYGHCPVKEIVIAFNDDPVTTKGDVLAVAEHAGV